MIHSNPQKVDVPCLDLLTLLFDSEHCAAKEDQVIHCEAADPSSCSITKAQARGLVKKIAHGLRTKFGVGSWGPGKDVVTVISFGQPLLPIVFYGVIAAGGIYSAAGAAATAAELTRHIQDGPSNLIICSPDIRKVAVTAAQRCGIGLGRVLILESVPSPRLVSIEGGRSAISDEQLDWDRPTDKETLETRTICLLYSSGTTGLPKGVQLSNTNLVVGAFIPMYTMREHLLDPERAGDPPFEYRTLAHLPPAHITGLLSYCLVPFLNGGITFWMPRFDFSKFLDYSKRHRITFVVSAPPIYLLIAKSPLVTDQFQTLRWALSGAAPMGKEVQDAANAKLGTGKTFVNQSWGSTETTGSVTLMPWGEHDTSGSVSRLLPNVELRIIDDDGKDVRTGEAGEMIIRGQIVTKGYHNNPAANEEAFVDGWYKTGDIGSVKERKVYLVDRKKELIKYKGFQVAPAELEGLLVSHPDITDAAVIGVEGMETELPRAYVVADSKKIGEAQIKEFVRENAAAYKQLRGGVIFIEAIPKSPAGKILRGELRALVQKEQGTKRRPKL